MQVVRIYKAMAIRDAFYKSGRVVFGEGDHLLMEVRAGSGTVFVSPAIGPANSRSFAYSTDDENWVWEHLLVELPWKDFSLGGKEVQSNGQGN